MKLFRFHLSTLLLASIFAGAAMGVWFASAVWQRQYSLAVEGLPSQRAAMAFDANRTHLFVCQNGEAYLFDLASKRALWQRSFYTQAYGDAAARFSTDGSLIELGFPEDQSPTEMQIHRARFLSVADGMDVERPTSVAPWRTDYYLVRRWDDDIDDPQMSKIRVRPSPEFFRYLRVTRGISPDGREVCDGAMIFSLQNHALGKS
ncbi:MAG TPA: hypothetical protein VKX17_06290, partial [Planctomycetota bacterium]|nr:hypothetical protein [Planctomycetota bacterium]